MCLQVPGLLQFRGPLNEIQPETANDDINAMNNKRAVNGMPRDLPNAPCD